MQEYHQKLLNPRDVAGNAEEEEDLHNQILSQVLDCCMPEKQTEKGIVFYCEKKIVHVKFV